LAFETENLKMIDLGKLADRACKYKTDNTKTQKDYLNDLSDFAHQLYKIVETAPNVITQKAFAHRADQALSIRHIIATNKSIGPLAYCLQMIEIENLAKSYLGQIKPIEEQKVQAPEAKTKVYDLKKQQQLAESIKNLREALFLALQDEGKIKETALLSEIEGDGIDAVSKCLKDCKAFTLNLPREAYEDFFQIWDQFGISTLRNTNTAILFFDSATETLLKTEGLNTEQNEQLTKTIAAGDESELNNLMRIFPMDQLITEDKMAIVKQAIDHESMTPLLVFSECEWLIDLMGEKGKELITYAKNKKRQHHQQIFENLYRIAMSIDEKITKPK